MKKNHKEKQHFLYLTLTEMNRLMDDNRQAISSENVIIVKACTVVVAFTMLACIAAALIIRQTHLVPAYLLTILVMTAEYFICCRCAKREDSYRFSSPLIYIFSLAVLGFAGYIIFFVQPSATYISYIGFMVLLSMLFIDKPLRQLAFFGILITVFILAELIINPMPATQTDAIVNVIIIPGCSLVLGWYNCGLKLKAFDSGRRLHILSTQDEGTGLGNRRSLFGDLRKMIEDSSVDGVFMIDVDDFKEYNDASGHLAGDQCLKKVAAALRDYGVSHGIEFYRFGGDEFAGLRNAASGADITEDAEALIRRVSAEAIAFPGRPGTFVTFSVGYTDTKNLSAEECIRRADEALYHAKVSGKCMAKKHLTV